MGILQIFTLLGALGMFLYGMNLMSSGLQMAAGDRLRGFLSAMTSNPFKRIRCAIICVMRRLMMWRTAA